MEYKVAHLILDKINVLGIKNRLDIDLPKLIIEDLN
jgi:hypothetical protein